MRTKLLLLVVAAGAALVFWTGCDQSTSGPGAYDFVTGAAGATAQFHLDSTCATNPFPSDALLGSNGLVSIPGSRFDYVLPRTAVYDTARNYIATVARTLDADGFSTIAPILLSLDVPVSTASVPAGIHFFVFSNGTPVPDGHAFSARWNGDLHDLMLQPVTPLAEHTRYGVVVSAALTTTAGAPTTRAPDFERFLQNSPPASITALMTAAANAGIPQPTVAEAFTFTTQTETADMVKVRDQVFGALGSSLTPVFLQPDPQLPGLTMGYF